MFTTRAPASATSLVLLDIDHFREINGKYGSSAGNKALRRLAALFRKTIKKDDFVARIGGDEFAFLFAGVPQNTAEAIAERLRQSVEALRFATTGGDGEHLTVSIGVAEVDGTATPAEFFGHAELALLSARCGARIEGLGSRRLTIRGVTSLRPIDTSIIPDRIEAATFAAVGYLNAGPPVR